MLRVFVLGSTALMSGIFWALIVEPWLDRRPRIGGFVEPHKIQKLEDRLHLTETGGSGKTSLGGGGFGNMVTAVLKDEDCQGCALPMVDDIVVSVLKAELKQAEARIKELNEGYKIDICSECWMPARIKELEDHIPTIREKVKVNGPQGPDGEQGSDGGNHG
jgi:hypothetical protein